MSNITITGKLTNPFGNAVDADQVETTDGSNVQTVLDTINEGEINASSFDNSYSSSLADTDLSTQETFLTFTADPNDSGSNHSSLVNGDSTSIEMDEAGYYSVSVNIVVENTSPADSRLVPDIRLYKRREGVAEVRDERSGYIRASTNDAVSRGPTSLVFELDFEDALNEDDQIRLSIQARTGSEGTNGRVTSCSVVVRRIEFAGSTRAVADAQILSTINALPSSNPNFYYERLRPSSGLETPATTYAISATGDGTDFTLVNERTSVGGILPDIPFENLFQGQVELTSDVDCSLELEGRFYHFSGLPAEFVTPRTLRIDLVANQPHTEELNGYSSEVAVSLGTATLPGGGTIDITEELIEAPFPYRLVWRMKAFQLGSDTTRVAANLSGFRLIQPAIVFKQANRVIGPRGLAGPAGPSTTVAALASRDVLTEPSSPPSASTTAQSFTLTLPSGIDSLTQYAFLEIGTSRTVSGQISYNLLSAATVVGATSSNPVYFFPTSGDAEYLGSTYSVYLNGKNTLVFRAGANRGFLRVVRGINVGAAQTPNTWDIQSTVVTPDSVSGTNTALPSPTSQYDAFRIASGGGFLRDRPVSDEGGWLLALQENADPNDLDDWDIINDDEFPVSSELYHFGEQITETQVGSEMQFSLSDRVKIARQNLEQALQDAITGGAPWATVAGVMFSGANVQDIGSADRIDYTQGYSKGIDWRDMSEGTAINSNRYIDDDLTISSNLAAFTVDGFGAGTNKVVLLQLQRNDSATGDGALMELGNGQAFIRVNTANQIQINTTPGGGSGTETWTNLNDGSSQAITLASGSDNYLLFELTPRAGGSSGEWQFVAVYYNGSTYDELNDVFYTPTSGSDGDDLGFSRSVNQRGQILRYSAIVSPGYLSHSNLDQHLRQHRDDKWNLGFATLVTGSTEKEVELLTTLKLTEVRLVGATNQTEVKLVVDDADTNNIKLGLEEV